MRHNRNSFRYANRKSLRAVDYIKRKQIITASLEGDKDLFEELRKMKQAGKAGPSKVDGIKSLDGIADQKINNRDPSGGQLKNLFAEVHCDCKVEDV